MLGEIGTLEWTRRTNGLLTTSERARYIASVVAAQSRLAPRLAAHRLGLRLGSPRDVPEHALAIPDSQLAQDAVSECRETQPAAFIEHNYRSFLFARALGALAGVDHDAELLFVATMFHDAGAVAPDLTDGGRCFTLRGAGDAEALLERHGDDERGPVAAEAITLHLNPAVGADHGPEAHLMHDGVLLDALGLRAWELPAPLRRQIRAAHPELGFTEMARRALGTEAKAIPRCRTAAALASGFGLALRFRAT